MDDKRASSSYLIWTAHKAVALIDMGGASLNYELSGAKFDDLDVVAFSHFHVDHSAIPEHTTGVARKLHIPVIIQSVKKQYESVILVKTGLQR